MQAWVDKGEELGALVKRCKGDESMWEAERVAYLRTRGVILAAAGVGSATLHHYCYARVRGLGGGVGGPSCCCACPGDASGRQNRQPAAQRRPRPCYLPPPLPPRRQPSFLTPGWPRSAAWCDLGFARTVACETNLTPDIGSRETMAPEVIMSARSLAAI